MGNSLSDSKDLLIPFFGNFSNSWDPDNPVSNPSVGFVSSLMPVYEGSK